MLKTLIQKQRESLDFFYKHIDYEHMQVVFQQLSGYKNLFFTGVGKSGHIARKAASSLNAISLKAYYLNYADALHGDIGLCQEGDALILLSKSGESSELFSMVEICKKKKMFTTSFCCSKESSLAKKTDQTLYLPLDRELDSHNLLPTNSCLIFSVCTDLFSIYCMEKSDLSLQEYQINHPAGAIGKRLKLGVRDLMIQDDKLPLCQLEDTLGSILDSFTQKKCGCVLVMNQNKQVEGIFTDGDLRRSLQKKGNNVFSESMKNLMTKDFRKIDPDAKAIEAIALMESQSPITILPVIAKNRLVGIIRMHDLIAKGLLDQEPL